MPESNVKQPKYKIGDKVRLNVGGPDMAIQSLTTQTLQSEFKGSYRCQWFAGKKLDNGVFPEDSLVPVLDEKINHDG